MTSIENDFSVFKIEGKRMYAWYKNVIIDLEAAKKVAVDRVAISNGLDYPIIVDIKQLKHITAEARKYFSTGDGIKYIKCLALVTDSPVSNMIGNFYMQIAKPKIPTRLFTSLEDAEAWLKQYE